MTALEQILELALALVLGLLVGIERGWKDRKAGEGNRSAGIRTFGFIGLTGGITGLLTGEFGYMVLVLTFLAFTLLIITAYIIEVWKEGDIGITTSIAALITFMTGVLVVLNYKAVAAAIAVTTTFLLSLKPQLHTFVNKIERTELLAGLKLLLISVVILPVLPNDTYGPWNAINPFEIWLLVILIASISFAGYLSLKIAGNRLGILFTSVAGGLASSTALTVSLGNWAAKIDQKQTITAGVLAAFGIMFPRVLIEISILNTALMQALLPPFVGMTLVCFLISGWLWLKNRKEYYAESLQIKNPFEIGFALKFGLLLTAIIVLSQAFQAWFGNSGLYAVSFLTGLADVDAISLTIARMYNEALPLETALHTITLAAISNTLAKSTIFSLICGWQAGKALVLYSIITGGTGALLLLIS